MKRPGSLAAPINTVGIPASLPKLRGSSSHSALQDRGSFQDLTRSPISEDSPSLVSASISSNDDEISFASIALEAQRLQESFSETPADSDGPVASTLRQPPVTPEVSLTKQSSIPVSPQQINRNVQSVARIGKVSGLPTNQIRAPKAINTGIPTVGNTSSAKREFTSPKQQQLEQQTSPRPTPNTVKTTPSSSIYSGKIQTKFNSVPAVSPEPVVVPPMSRIPSGPRSRIPVSPIEKPINQTGIPIISPTASTKKPESRIPTFSNSSKLIYLLYLYLCNLSERENSPGVIWSMDIIKE